VQHGAGRATGGVVDAGAVTEGLARYWFPICRGVHD